MPRTSSRRRNASSPPEGPPSSRARLVDEPTFRSRGIHQGGVTSLVGRRPLRTKPNSYYAVLQPLEAKDTALAVNSVDFHLQENRDRHHTNEYEVEDLIVRRGQEFKLSVDLARDYNETTDELVLQLSIGPDPVQTNDTLIRLSLKSKSMSDWRVAVNKVVNNVVTVSVLPPANAIVGKYALSIETRENSGGSEAKISRKKFEDPIYVLFNAWCKDDTVYMENEVERNEYVMNESGAIFTGSAKKFGPRPWTYGQFEDVCLEAVIFLLEESNLSVTQWGNPVRVVRTLSAMTNSMDDDGVLEGRWDGNYPAGTTKPWKWTGSVDILVKFMKTKKSVQYGQCWVFSGLTTTLLRTVGIPTRSVTNFESAHDSDETITIDKYWNADDTPNTEESDDSVWNFHVWNESWFCRPDLPEGYDGWQAHDATPQEMSEGVMRCGPAPLKAIKEGHVWLNYDAPFIFAEVNGDKLHWQEQENGSLECVHKETSAIGRFISTKAPGRRERLDVTNLYKYPEGSYDERRVVASVFRRSKLNKRFDVYEPDITKDVDFKEEIASETKHGEDFSLPVVLTNNSTEPRTVMMQITAIASFYTGVTSERIKAERFKVIVQPNASETVSMLMSTNDYMDKLTKGDFVKVYIRALVEETGQRYFHSEAMQLQKPLLIIHAPESVKLQEDFDLSIKFTNSLGRKLTDVALCVSGAGIVRDLEILLGSVAIGGTVTEEMTLRGKRTGQRELVVTLESNEVNDISGSKEIFVTAN